MFQDPGIMNIRVQETDHMDMLACTSSGNHGMASQATNRPRSTIVNQDLAASQQALKCPRCDSTNTKFCYYNNYSQTQPRHFCKTCRRYWTQGGVLRNVPVGGGCRKNKRVKSRPLINMGGVAGFLDPTCFTDDTTSNMLARLSGFPNFGAGATSGTSFSDDGSSQLLNIAFSRFQEAMRLREQPSESTPFFDMSFPDLVHKPCHGDTCGNRASLHSSAGGGGLGGASAFDFTTLPMKMEHEGSCMASYCNNSFEVNPLYDQANTMVGTSATATLASIEDQLSTFSNLPHVTDAFNATDASAAVQDVAQSSLMDGVAVKRLRMAPPLQLLAGENAMQSINSTDLSSDAEEKAIPEEKPLINDAVSTGNGLSLQMMPVEHWHQPSFMNELLFEPHQNLWSSHAPPSRWQDMIHPMATTATAAAGAVL